MAETVHESPLVRNRTMQRMYEGIVESRMLEEFVRDRRGKTKVSNVYGQEACRIGALIDLEPEDMVTDIDCVSTPFLRGVTLRKVVAHVDAHLSGKKKSKTADYILPGLLPTLEDAEERLRIALGAALALRRNELRKVVVAFASADDVKMTVWRDLLRYAGRNELPMLFVVLPEKHGKAEGLSQRATAEGVPGIPVDANDAVALYRVAQESVGRARAGGGAALMECIAYRLEGEKKPEQVDPIAAMGQTLLHRQVANQQWMERVATSFQARLDAFAPKS